MGDEVIDFPYKLFDGGERSSADRFVSDQGEEAFDQIEPGTVGGDEVQMPSRALRQPRFDLGVLVSAIVVYDHMQVQILWHGLLDGAQKTQEFLMAMPRLALRDDVAGEDIKGCKQRGRAVPDIVVGQAFDVPQAKRQHRLSALQRLHLALFVYAQHHGVVGRIEVQAYDISHFFR